MKKLVWSLDNYDYTGNIKNEDSNDQEEAAITVEQSKIASHTDSSKEEDSIK